MIKKVMAFWVLLRTVRPNGDAAHQGEYAAKAVNSMFQALKQPSNKEKPEKDVTIIWKPIDQWRGSSKTTGDLGD